MLRNHFILMTLLPGILLGQDPDPSTAMDPIDYTLDYATEFPEDQDSGGALTLTSPGNWDMGTVRIENGDSPETGTVSLTNGAPGEVLWTYSHVSNHYGSDAFRITLDDTGGSPHHIEINFVQLAANDVLTVTMEGECTATAVAPLESQLYTLAACILEEDGDVDFSLTAEDELDGIGATPFNITQQSTNGTLTAIGNGNYRYAPDPDFYGPDIVQFDVTDASGFTIQLAIPFEIESVDDGPTAIVAYPGSAEEQEAGANTFVTRSVTFSDPDGLGLNDVQLAHADNAHLPQITDEVVNPDGTLTVSFEYSALDDFFGTDLIEFSIIDLEGNMNSLEVPIEVNGTPDPTVILSNEYATTTLEEVDLSGSFSLTDLDGYSAGFLTLDTPPSNGSVVLNETGLGSGSWTYTPNLDYSGDDDGFTMSTMDDFNQSQIISISFYVEDMNDPLTATVLSESGHPLMDNVTFTDENEVWTAATQDIDENSSIVLSVSIQDDGDGFDPDNGFSYASPTYASLDITTDGTSWTITALDEVSGPESISVDIVDEKGNTITWIFPLDIHAVNDGDISVTPQSADVLEDEANEIAVTIQDPDGIETDGTGNPTMLTASASKGTTNIQFGVPYLEAGVILHPATITYTSPQHFYGLDTIEFALTDRQGFSSNSKLVLTVQNTPDDPITDNAYPPAPHY